MADRYFRPGEEISLTGLGSGVIEINVFSDTSVNPLTGLNKPLVNIGPILVGSTNTRPLVNGQPTPLLVFLGAGPFPFGPGPRTQAGLDWAGIRTEGTLTNLVWFTGAIRGNLTGSIEVRTIVQFDAVEGAIQSAVLTSGSEGMGWIRAKSFSGGSMVSAALGNIERIQTFNGSLEGRVLAQLGSINIIDVTTGTISIAPSPGILARDGVGSIVCQSMNGSIYANYLGTGDLGRLSTTTGNFFGYIEANRLKSSSFSDGLRIAGQFTGNAIFSGNIEQQVSLLRLGTGSSIVAGGSLVSPQQVQIADPAGLKGQIIINRSNASGQWNAPVVVGTGNPALAPLPAYTTPSSQLGGGAVGLVPFRYYASDCAPFGDTPDDANNNPTPPLSSQLNNGGEIKLAFYGPVRASNATGVPIDIGIVVPGMNSYMRVTDRFDVIVRPSTGGNPSRFVTIKGKSGAIYGSGLYYVAQSTVPNGSRLVSDIPGANPPLVPSFGYFFLVKRDCNGDNIADAIQRKQPGESPYPSGETFAECVATRLSDQRRDCDRDGVLDSCALLNGRCYADLTYDCNVDDADFQVFANAYSQVYSCIGDFDGDGITDEVDFNIFTRYYDALVCSEDSCLQNVQFRASICGQVP